LNKKISTFAEAKEEFSKHFFSQPRYKDQLALIVSKLEEVGFTELTDFQFMINTSNIENPISIIDAGLFRSNPNSLNPTPHETKLELLANIRRLQGYAKVLKKKSRWPFKRK